MKESDIGKAPPRFVIIESNLETQDGSHDVATLEEKVTTSGSVQENQADKSSGTVARRYTKSELEKRKIIHSGMKDDRGLNAFRRLRSSLLGKLGTFNCCIMVSSVNRDGGASFVASNLAVAFAMDEQKNSLLVDCNFSQPSQHETFQIENNSGLYDYLNGLEPSIENIIHRTMVPRVNLVPAGRPESDDQIEYFTSKRMQDFLTEVKKRYEDRIIIIDSPPILESADSKVIAELCEHVLLVIPYNNATPLRVKQTVKEFGQEKIIGCVINN